MTSKLLAGASAIALFAFASTAMANPQNNFSDNNTTNLNSAASASGGAGGLGVVGNGGAGGNAAAYSESYNTNQNGVSVQTLVATSNGAALSLEVIPVFSGNAVIGGNAQQNAAGVVSASSNTGMHAINQQATSIGAVGTVSIN